MPQSGDQIIIRNFDLMKTGKIIRSHDCQIWIFNLLFGSHEIRPPDPESSKSPMAYWHDTYGITYEPLKPVGGTPQVLLDEITYWGGPRKC
jgi:hypothetical protein